MVVILSKAKDLGKLASVLSMTASVALAQGQPPPQSLPGAVPGDQEPSDLDRYQDCIQKMVDAGATDNSFMKKCLGLPDKPPPKKGPNGELPFLSKSDVNEVVLDNISGVTDCYVKLLGQVKDLGVTPEGTVDPRFDVTPQGQVEGVVFEPTSLTDVGLLGCVREKLKTWVFPKTNYGERVNVKLSFRLYTKEVKGKKAGIAAQSKGFPRISGPGYGLSSEDILGVFRKNVQKVRWCYDEYTKKKPAGGSGNVGVDLSVSSSGKVTKVHFREITVGDETFKTCVEQRLKKWRFPKPRGGEAVVVKYPPFVFAPKP